MSRFDKTQEYIPENIDKSRCDKLMQQLESSVKDEKSTIEKAVEAFTLHQKEYSIIEISDSIVLVIRRSNEQKTTLCIGYPFRLFAKESDPINTEENLDIRIHLRGEVLRSEQREMLFRQLEKRYASFKYNPITSEQEFQELAHKYCVESTRDNPSIVYVDPYDFIGDSIIGLHFADYFVSTYGISNVKVLTTAYKHTDSFYTSSDKNEQNFDEATKGSTLVVMPDLIDNHFEHTMRLLDRIKDKKLIVFLVSRNLIIDFRGHSVVVHHVINEDVLLKSESVREYMDNCLNPYMSQSPPEYKKRPEIHCSDPTKVVINPFSSDLLKDLSPQEASEIINHYRTGSSQKIYVALGVNGRRESKWLDEFQQARSSRKTEIAPITDRGMADLARQITRQQIKLALTVDTGVAYLLTRTGIPNITIYNDGFWDKKSPLSLSAESPLGFCNTETHQIPAIRPKDNPDKSFFKKTSQALEDLSSNFQEIKGNRGLSQDLENFRQELAQFIQQTQNHMDLEQHDEICKKYHELKRKYSNSPYNWIFELFNPTEILAGIVDTIDPRKIPLIHSAWRISPVYKISNIIG